MTTKSGFMISIHFIQDIYAEYLDLVEEEKAKTYSDVALLLTQYKGSMKRFSNERM